MDHQEGKSSEKSNSTGQGLPESGKVAAENVEKSSPEVKQTLSPEAKGTDPWAAFDLDDFHLIPPDAAVYNIKVHKYKEIKHYIKGEKLGKGKFGTVREFVDKYTLKRFAGKIIKKYAIKRDPHLRRSINKELAITYHFDHPNILRVYDLFFSKEKIYLFMEFCYGELTEFIVHYNTLPKCQSKDYFGQISDGLDYLHLRGVIHRDIKPDNILVSLDNWLKLADFGVCQNVDMFSETDLVGGNDGTPLYHSCEMFDPDVMRYSGSSVDIWAAAVVLYQMVTGEVPFFKKQMMTPEDHHAILHKNIDYPPEVREDILLVDLFNKLFEKKFMERISIAQIRKHPWMQIKCRQKTEHFKTFPIESRSGDNYRGLTVITRIHEKYYPKPDSETKKLVTLKARDDSMKPTPLFRGNRAPTTKKNAEIKRAKINFNS